MKKYDISLPKGDNLELKFKIKTADGYYTYVDTDKVVFTVKETPHDKEAVIEKDSLDGITFDDEWFTLVVPSEDTKIKDGTYRYSVKLIKAYESAKIQSTLLVGDLKILDEV